MFVPKRILVGVVILGASGCAIEDAAGRTDAVRGKQLYQENCAACHGARGEGAGEASLGLGAPPPGLTQLSAMNGGVFPRDFVLATIDGLERHDIEDAAMPEFGAGNMGPLATWAHWCMSKATG